MSFSSRTGFLMCTCLKNTSSSPLQDSISSSPAALVLSTDCNDRRSGALKLPSSKGFSLRWASNWWWKIGHDKIFSTLMIATFPFEVDFVWKVLSGRPGVECVLDLASSLWSTPADWLRAWSFPSSWSIRSRIARLAGSKLKQVSCVSDLGTTKVGVTYVDKSVEDDETHLAPTRSQNEHLGFRLSHLVFRARQTWHAVFARFLGYEASPRAVCLLLLLVLLVVVEVARANSECVAPGDSSVSGSNAFRAACSGRSICEAQPGVRKLV